MHLLSVQGKYAPAFQLNEKAEEQLRHEISGVLKNPVMIVSSRFRSDLIYHDTFDSLLTSLEKWCRILGIHYSETLKMKFFRSDEEATSLYYFFYRLHLIKRIPAWYNGYLEKLRKALMENPHHAISQKLSPPLEHFLKTVELQKQKTEKEAEMKAVSQFIQMKKLAANNMRNCN